MKIIHAKGCPIFRKLVSVYISTTQYMTLKTSILSISQLSKEEQNLQIVSPEYILFLLNDPVVNRYECSLLKKPSNLPSLELISSNLPSLELFSSNLPSLELFSSNLPYLELISSVSRNTHIICQSNLTRQNWFLVFARLLASFCEVFAT